MSSIPILNPQTGETLYEIQECHDEEIGNIYVQAQTVQLRLSDMHLDMRAELAHNLMHHIQEKQEVILDQIVAETGKSRTDGLTSEIFGALDAIEYLSAQAPATLSDRRVSTPLVLMGKSSKVWFEPLGVVLIIAPWNYPFYQTIIPAISAFLAGNAVIIKPSELTPLKGLIEDLLQGCGFPPHAIQIVYGGKETGQKLVEARPDQIFFTGSVNTGRKIMQTAAQHVIPLTLELGGKDPMIVFDDVNLERTVNGAVWGAFTNAGQSCTSVERLYVQRSIYPQFIKMLHEKTLLLRTQASSPGFDNRDMGHMTAPFQIETLKQHLNDAEARGAKILCGGQHETGSLFFPPTLIVDVNHEMEIMQAESFGPLLPVMSFETEAEAIALANDSIFGLSASVWSSDQVRAERVARKLQVGNVSINNVMLTEGNPALPFGGIKESGFGRYKGTWGLESFCNIKSVIIDKQSSKIEANWYPYTPSKYKGFSQLCTALFSTQKSLLKMALHGLKLESLANKEKLK